MSTPEQHVLPVYACAAGAVLHAHAAGTLEPAVLLHTFLPPGGAEGIDAGDARVDVHGNGPGAADVTVRVLSQGRSLSWQLPIAPLVAALPGQPGDEGRMVLLAVLDAEPEQGFWAQPVDCERLAAELQLPVADVVDALHGRLTPWLADDLDILLHDDAHEHAADRSPAQTLATAVLAHYRGDLSAEQANARLVRALELAPPEFQVELAGRLAQALVAAVGAGGPAGIAAVEASAGPFETEVLRLLSTLPAALAAVPGPDTAAQVVLDGADRDESVRAAVSVIARLARSAFGADLAADEVLRRLGMVDDAGLARLAGLWVELAVAAAGRDDSAVPALTDRVRDAGPPALQWLRGTAAALASEAVEVAGRSAGRLAEPLAAVRRLLEDDASGETAAEALSACLTLARFVRARAGVGPRAWLHAPSDAAARAVGTALVGGLDRDIALDLLDELLETDVEGPDLVEAFVCATSQLLVHVPPYEVHDDGSPRRQQVEELLAAVPAGARGARWLLVDCLREAPHHDSGAPDLSSLLTGEPTQDVDRLASRAGRRGVLAAGLTCLDALADVFGDVAEMPREELLSLVLPSALVEHDLLSRPV